MIELNLPRNQDTIGQIRESLRFISKVEEESKRKHNIELDLSEVEWIIPCSSVLIVSKLKETLNKGISIYCIPPKYRIVKNYLNNIGFPFKVKDNIRSTPIKHFSNDRGSVTQIHQESNNLIKSVKHRVPDTLRSGLSYILTELSDNIDQHSEFNSASLMAQYYPRKEYLDIAILDDGISIPHNFERNSINFKSDSHAIEMAISGNNSTKKNENGRGYGMKSCRDISLKTIKGKLYIISRKGVVTCEGNQEPKISDLKNTELKGTCIYLGFPTPEEKINIYEHL